MTQRIIRAGEGEVLGSVNGCRDRFLINSRDWGGRFAVVEHLLAPHSIAAPMHRHTKEDEFSLILQGDVWFHAAGEEHVATVGDLVFKPRGEWHTFWNAADEPARLLEIISPGGLEEAFRLIGTAPPDLDLGLVIEPYGCEGDMDAMRLCPSWRSTGSHSGECPTCSEQRRRVRSRRPPRAFGTRSSGSASFHR